MAGPEDAPLIYISHHAENRSIFDALVEALRRTGWPDSRTFSAEHSDNTQALGSEERSSALERAGAVVAILSPRYLASDFVRFVELPDLEQRRQRDGLPVYGLFPDDAMDWWREPPVGTFNKLRLPKRGAPTYADEMDPLAATIVAGATAYAHERAATTATLSSGAASKVEPVPPAVAAASQATPTGAEPQATPAGAGLQAAPSGTAVQAAAADAESVAAAAPPATEAMPAGTEPAPPPVGARPGLGATSAGSGTAGASLVAEATPDGAAPEAAPAGTELDATPTTQGAPATANAQVVPSDADPSASPQAALPDGWLPIERWRDWSMSPLVVSLLQHAQALATATLTDTAIPLSSGVVLYAMPDLPGQTSRPTNAVEWFQALLAESGGTRRLGAARDVYWAAETERLELLPDTIRLIAAQPPGVLAADLEATLVRARAIAQQTAGTDVIGARHLLPALVETLASTPIGTALLHDLGLEMQAARARFFDWVIQGPGEVPGIWRQILGLSRADVPMVTFDADIASDNDLLNITPDVQAFAALIAASSVAPPLSIGLFGEWGSGKTFFMHQLQREVARLADRARNSGHMQREVAFYKRIVQIEFNAWHYAEGNLWASLVDHIFANLRVSGEAEKSAVDALREHWLDQLKVREQLEVEARQREQTAREELDHTKQELTAAKTDLQNDALRLAELSAEDVLNVVVLPGDERKKLIDPVLEELNVAPVGDRARDLLAALDEAGAVVHRGHSLLAPLVHGKDQRRRWLLLLAALVVPVVLAVGVGLVLSVLGQQAIAQTSEALAATAALLATGATWLRGQARWVNSWIARAEQAKHRIDALVAERQAEKAQGVAELEQQLARRQADYTAAQQRRIEAERRLAEARMELKQATVGPILSRFIADRADSADYRKYLGILAVVRQDFERLSSLIELQNQRLALPADAETPANAPKPFASLEEEDAERGTRINRIVLYIDDLDRCPPRKVVQVLQAIHLLLAFPLFVVVVGVDARWVAAALQRNYEQLIDNPTPDDGQRRGRRRTAAATTDDYLEKIFQIPFWLQPTDVAAGSHMLHGLLQRSLVMPVRPSPNGNPSDGAQPAPQAPGRAGQQRDAQAGQDDKGQSAPRPAQPVLVDGSTPSPAATSAATAAPQAAAPPSASEPRAQTVDAARELNPPGLQIGAAELGFIESLAPLMDRSPRALKRFVNVYRLIKVGMERDGFAAPAQADHISNHQTAVLFLLAVSTGSPALAARLLAELRTWHASRGEPDVEVRDVAWLMGRLEPAATSADRFALARIRSWLQPANTAPPLSADLDTLAVWAPVVSRYSFKLGPRWG